MLLKNILLFGAGKSATVLIEYLLYHAPAEQWHLTVVDADLELARSKTVHSTQATAVSFNINDDAERRKYIAGADIVISMLPALLHILVANDCLLQKKNLLTASYADEAMKKLSADIQQQGLIFLCEMGLDPGIDHMSAMKMIDSIREEGGRVTSFQSHCGGLVAPESDDNPWHYKLSWSPRSVVLAGKSGAHFREQGLEKWLPYEALFVGDHIVDIPGLGKLCWYPNRDSLSYAPLYGLENATSFIRTTLRYPEFMYGWKNLVDLKLTDETPIYDTNGKSLYELFREHMDKNGFGLWLEQKMQDRFAQTKDLLDNLVKLMEAEKNAEAEHGEVPREFMSVDEAGNINEIELEVVKNRAASFLAHKMQEANLALEQLFFLGLDDHDTMVNKGRCSAADILQFAMEHKMGLQPTDRDMIVMLHEIESVKENKPAKWNSLLIVKGEDSRRTAMAKTVGLPLGIAAKLILNGTIHTTGLQIPTSKEIYQPVLQELEQQGIKFIETTDRDS